MVRAPFPHHGQGVAAENSDSLFLSLSLMGKQFETDISLEKQYWMNIAHELCEKNRGCLQALQGGVAVVKLYIYIYNLPGHLFDFSSPGT